MTDQAPLYAFQAGFEMISVGFGTVNTSLLCAMQSLVSACLLLASKVEEVPVSNNHLLNSASILDQASLLGVDLRLAQDPASLAQPTIAAASVLCGPEYYRVKQDVLSLEQVLLRKMHFMLNVDHPHPLLFSMLPAAAAAAAAAGLGTDRSSADGGSGEPKGQASGGRGTAGEHVTNHAGSSSLHDKGPATGDDTGAGVGAREGGRHAGLRKRTVPEEEGSDGEEDPAFRRRLGETAVCILNDMLLYSDLMAGQEGKLLAAAALHASVLLLAEGVPCTAPHTSTHDPSAAAGAATAAGKAAGTAAAAAAAAAPAGAGGATESWVHEALAGAQARLSLPSALKKANKSGRGQSLSWPAWSQASGLDPARVHALAKSVLEVLLPAATALAAAAEGTHSAAVTLHAASLPAPGVGAASGQQ
ncbi:MAG: hypothetical protein WDW38_010958 [Sanguina aurantia]